MQKLLKEESVSARVDSLQITKYISLSVVFHFALQRRQNALIQELFNDSYIVAKSETRKKIEQLNTLI
jgi:hypothetical protein